MDTDAAGIYHWATVFRLLEAAEAELHERLGIRETTFGRTPRVHVTCDFRRELRFFDLVELTLAVSRVGRSSATYHFTLADAAPDKTAAEGTLVVAFTTGSPGGRAMPWPADLRDRLLNGGDQGRAGAG